MKKIFSLMAVFLVAHFAGAQEINQTQRQFKRNTATIIFSSLGGGILGLSTLSFYGRPEEHTDNITSGAALGLIGGIIYVVMDSSKPQPQGVFSQKPWIESADFMKVAKTNRPNPVFTFNYSF